MTPDSMDAVFAALGNPTRRQILDIVKNDPGCSITEVCSHFEMSRIAVMKHLRILEGTDLIQSEKVGRKRSLYMNAVPIQMIPARINGTRRFLGSLGTKNEAARPISEIIEITLGRSRFHSAQVFLILGTTL